MPPFNLSASSPDAWQALQLSYGDRFTNAAIGNRDDARQAAVINLNAYLQAQREDDAARARDQSTRLGLWQFGIQRGDRQAAVSEDRRKFDIRAGLEREGLSNERLRFGAINQKEQARAEEAAAKFQETFAAEDAEKGAFGSESDVTKKYTALPKEAVKHYFDRSTEVRDAIKTEQKRLEDARDVMNRAAQLRQYVTLSEQATKKMPGWVDSPNQWSPFKMRNPDIPYEKARIKDWNAELYGAGYNPRNPTATTEPNNLSMRAASLAGQKNVTDFLTQDPNTGSYIAPPRPAFFEPPTTTGTLPPAALRPSPDALIAEAEAAVRAGADPERVKARLRELGVSLR